MHALTVADWDRPRRCICWLRGLSNFRRIGWTLCRCCTRETYSTSECATSSVWLNICLSDSLYMSVCLTLSVCFTMSHGMSVCFTHTHSHTCLSPTTSQFLSISVHHSSLSMPACLSACTEQSSASGVQLGLGGWEFMSTAQTDVTRFVWPITELNEMATTVS